MSSPLTKIPFSLFGCQIIPYWGQAKQQKKTWRSNTNPEPKPCRVRAYKIAHILYRRVSICAKNDGISPDKVRDACRPVNTTMRRIERYRKRFTLTMTLGKTVLDGAMQQAQLYRLYQGTMRTAEGGGAICGEAAQFDNKVMKVKDGACVHQNVEKIKKRVKLLVIWRCAVMRWSWPSEGRQHLLHSTVCFYIMHQLWVPPLVCLSKGTCQ